MISVETPPGERNVATMSPDHGCVIPKRKRTLPTDGVIPETLKLIESPAGLLSGIGPMPLPAKSAAVPSLEQKPATRINVETTMRLNMQPFPSVVAKQLYGFSATIFFPPFSCSALADVSISPKFTESASAQIVGSGTHKAKLEKRIEPHEPPCCAYPFRSGMAKSTCRALLSNPLSGIPAV